MKMAHCITGLSLTLLLAACGQTRNFSKDTITATLPVSPPDYSQLYYWAAHPDKQDLSDSTPNLYRTSAKDTSVDVFFLHPTTLIDEKLVRGKPLSVAYWNASLQDSALNQRTDNSSILNQASPFNKYRVYAPRYRQAHYQSFLIADSLSKPFLDTAYDDIRKAFEYYLAFENGGRPFIIAAHSQGTLHAGRLIREMIEGKPLQEKMVVAYLPGLAIPETYFTQCKPCAEAAQINCFVGWRTFRKGYVPAFVQQENFRSVVINPVSWTVDTNWVPRSEHHGAVLYKFQKPKPQNVSVKISGNILWSTKPRFFGNIFFTRKNYHIGDINLFWKDIRDNADLRVTKYRQVHQ